MKNTRAFLILVGVVAVLMGSARQSQAEAYVSPWGGVIFGSSADNGRGTFGVGVGAMGGGIIGGELNFGYSPSFFGTKNDFGNNSVIDVMGNVIVGVPVGGTHGAGIRPYVTGGVGLIRTQIDGGTIANVSSATNKFGWNAGAGVMGFVSEHVGFRFDARYLRTSNSDIYNGVTFGDLHFWHVTGGLVLR